MKAKTDISPSLKVHSSKCLKLKFSFLFMEKPGKDYKTPRTVVHRDGRTEYPVTVGQLRTGREWMLESRR